MVGGVFFDRFARAGCWKKACFLLRIYGEGGDLGGGGGGSIDIGQTQ